MGWVCHEAPGSSAHGRKASPQQLVTHLGPLWPALTSSQSAAATEQYTGEVAQATGWRLGMADTELGVQMKNKNLTEARLRQRWRRGRKTNQQLVLRKRTERKNG